MKSLQLYTSSYCSPIGNLLMIAKSDALLRLDFEDEKANKRIEELLAKEEMFKIETDFPYKPAILQETTDWLDAYFDRRKLPPSPPIQFDDTPFRMLVWNLLLDIPYGKTISYKEMAN